MAKYAATLPLTGIHLDRASSVPLYLQLYEQIRRAILAGRLTSGGRLPSTRGLAESLGISRNTVTTAFDQLLAEGYITGKVGAGTYIAEVPVDEMNGIANGCRIKVGTVEQMAISSRQSWATDHFFSSSANLSQQAGIILAMRDITLRYRNEQPRAFRPGLPALDAFPKELWCKLMAKHGRSRQSDLFGYGDPCGYQPLREHIAEYLRIARAMHCEAEQVIIVSGCQQALYLTASVLLNPGDAVWIEDPGYLGARSVLQSAGAELVPVPVDEQGLNIETGIARNPHAKLAYVTPSHQFPLGHTMSLTRRLSLLQWAAQARAWILEDDYDSEYRFTGQPLTSLHGLDSQRVIYMGTFSKVLFPSLRLGYLVVPPELVEVFAIARALIDRHSPQLEQAVLTDFIAEGHLTRHIRRMRMLYAERQAALISALQPMADLLTVYPAETGMHLIAWLHTGIDDRAVSLQAAQQGVTAQPLSAYRIEPSMQNGLVLGYAATHSDDIRKAVQELESILRSIQNLELNQQQMNEREQEHSLLALSLPSAS